MPGNRPTKHPEKNVKNDNISNPSATEPEDSLFGDAIHDLIGNSDKTQTEKTNDPNSSKTKCPHQNSANSPRQNSSASSVTDPRGTNSMQHTDKKAFTDFQATDEIVLKYDFTDSRKHTTYKAATMLHGLEFVE
ncbi:hypothetical protein RhiirA5_432778 [Rhizophagus irregularis]|uniref:Uncharacterized protein n=1 Tax=Rhizophagus irregularis TaxID=588596 RepID=A0A2N0NSR9_9GLOM|nr:hypothetical protein RhiirA5_432778 [Rhizophagus irregularis]